MTISTRSKIAIARQLRHISHMLACLSGTIGPDGLVRVRRKGANWVLDLSEGIDLSIYMVGGFERATHAAYRRLLSAGDVCIDIGANIGSHTLPLAGCVGEQGLVIAVEPTAGAYNKLQVNVNVNPDLAERIQLLQAMVTANDNDPLEDGIYASWPLVRSRESNDVPHERHLGVRLSTSGARAGTLATLLSKFRLQRVDLIKIDVDGYEMDVLEGARQLLAEFRPLIIMELAPYTWEERGVPSDAPIRFLQEMNYRFSDLSGKPFSGDGYSVPEIPSGHSINIIARSDHR